MKPRPLSCLSLAALLASAVHAAPPALTIYNQNFAVVRERLSLDLKAGRQAVTFADATLQVEPDSVVLRDPAGKVQLRILEQSYRAETVSPELLLKLNEGRVLRFVVRNQDGKDLFVSGKVIRSGYQPGGNRTTPIIEVDGELRFSLPGEPLFPTLGDDSVLNPTLSWQLEADRPAKLDAELGYVTGGLSWQASYNLVSPETGDTLDVIGWVTVNNDSGKTFDEATVKLMAGNVNKVQPRDAYAEKRMRGVMIATGMAQDVVTEKAFDEFHLYSLPRPVTLRNQETKQVEFLRGSKVKAETIYVYDGSALGGYRGWPPTDAGSPGYGPQSNKQVWVLREFMNTSENGLGVPLPAGRVRFYRQDDADGRLEFTGENTLEHTARNERVRLYTGNAFDVVGERVRTDVKTNMRQETTEEAFTITLRNRKATPIEVRVIEHVHVGRNPRLLTQSDPSTALDAGTIEFRVKVEPNAEKKVEYRVRYE